MLPEVKSFDSFFVLDKTILLFKIPVTFYHNLPILSTTIYKKRSSRSNIIN